MPWKRRSACKTPKCILAGAIAAAAAVGVISCLLGSTINAGVSALAAKYSRHKTVAGNYSTEQISAAVAKQSGR